MIAKWKVVYLVPWAFFDTNKMHYQTLDSFKSNTDSTPHLELPNTEKSVPD